MSVSREDVEAELARMSADIDKRKLRKLAEKQIQKLRAAGLRSHARRGARILDLILGHNVN